MDDEYDDAADRVGDTVPDSRTGQTEIREWVENNIDWGHEDDHDTDTLNREVSRRVADNREGRTVDGERRFYDPGSGRWRSDTGSFAPDPDE